MTTGTSARFAPAHVPVRSGGVGEHAGVVPALLGGLRGDELAVGGLEVAGVAVSPAVAQDVGRDPVGDQRVARGWWRAELSRSNLLKSQLTSM